MLSRGAFSLCNAITDHNQSAAAASSLISQCHPRFFNFGHQQGRNCFLPSSGVAHKCPVLAVATGEPNTKQTGFEPSLADRLRLGSLTQDGLSYKEKFIVRCYEVGINKTATVETIANLLQVNLLLLISGTMLVKI